MRPLTIAHSFYRFIFTSALLFSGSVSAQPTQTPSDKYCGYLQLLQAKAYHEQPRQNVLENIIDFANSLMNKLSLEKLQQEAIQSKMTFEEFQRWASEIHSTKVRDHYKPKYLEGYMKEVCGEITNSATFGAEPQPEMGTTAAKQFDPKGHAYATDVPNDESKTPGSGSN